MGNILNSKTYQSIFRASKALDNICFKAYSGEVLAFLGGEWAGKSTLLKVLNGDYQPDEGGIPDQRSAEAFQGRPTRAIEEGISVIYQGQADPHGADRGREYLPGTYAGEPLRRDQHPEGQRDGEADH